MEALSRRRRLDSTARQTAGPAWNDIDGRRVRDWYEMADRANIRQYLELEIGLDHRLHLEAVRPFRGIAESDGDRIPFPHIAARHVNGE